MKRFLKNEYVPQSLVIDITTSCSAKCPFCAREKMNKSRKNNFMEFETFESVLKEAKEIGISNISLYQTGEAMLHPEFTRFIQHAKQEGFIITVSTNGSDVEKHIDTLLLVDNVRFSIDGWDKESFELLRFPLKYEKIKSNLKLLCDAKKTNVTKMKIGINNIFSKKSNFSLFLKNWGELIDYLEISPLFPATYFDGKAFQVSYEDKLKEHYFDLEYVSNEKKWCHFPFYVPVISFDGKISLCCQDFSSQFNLGYVKDGLMKAFNCEEINQIRQEFVDMTYDTCSKCQRFLELKEEDKVFVRSEVENALQENEKFRHIKIEIKV